MTDEIDVTEEEIDAYLRRDPEERSREIERLLARRILYGEKRAALERERRERERSGGE